MFQKHIFIDFLQILLLEQYTYDSNQKVFLLSLILIAIENANRAYWSQGFLL
jgi:hypothetical protein